MVYHVYHTIWYTMYAIQYGIPCMPYNMVYHAYHTIWYTMYTIQYGVPCIPYNMVYHVYHTIWYTMYTIQYGIPCIPYNMVYHVYHILSSTIHYPLTNLGKGVPRFSQPFIRVFIINLTVKQCRSLYAKVRIRYTTFFDLLT